MKQNEVFGSAVWIAATEFDIEAAPVIRRSFTARHGERAVLRIIGFGTFVAYLNGKRISDDYFLPFSSEYEKIDQPEGEELFGNRVYVTEYDVTDYIKDGQNTLAIMLGEGWYTGVVQWDKTKKYGEKKCIYSLEVGDKTIVSDGSERWAKTFVVGGDMHQGEVHDYTAWSEECLGADFDDSAWETVRLADAVESDYLFSDCPADKIMGTLPVSIAYECDKYTVYDCGVNTSGYPVIEAEEGSDNILVTFSEDISPCGKDIDEKHVHWQRLVAKTAGKAVSIYPIFTWYGFRYFRVEGKAKVKEVKVIHANVEVSSYFTSSNETLNWTYNAFINTQLTNMHRGIPSDCPHIERLGYTGDGQLACRSALLSLDAKEFYKKWIGDISDCQDKITGRVQYTAPYFICGGGAGGWGCAIVVVPYEYYKYYGDDTYIRQLYPQMQEFLRFLEEHSEYDLVTSFKEGRWCLGDWCTPVKWTLPTPFVNTYFRVWTTEMVIEIARLIGREEDIPKMQADIAKCKKAINTVYFNSFERDDCFCANAQGAHAFALGIGLGTKNTKDKFINYYDELGYYDTGIFATELVTRRLFELGRADVAFKLLTAEEPHGFGRWRKIGSTTLREYWGDVCRSYSHPMFGAVVATFFEYILGIKQAAGSVGYREVEISPEYIAALDMAKGHIKTPLGRIAVEYTTEGSERTYKITVPDGMAATFTRPGIERVLTPGENVILEKV